MFFSPGKKFQIQGLDFLCHNFLTKAQGVHLVCYESGPFPARHRRPRAPDRPANGDRVVKRARKILGVFGLLVATCIATSALTPYFLTSYNIENLLRRTSLFGVISIGAAFVDVGMGLELDEGSLGGILRVTASTPEKRDHARQRISFVGGGAKDIYASNIQVADLNALNAVLAVVKWKKIRGFYRDLEREHHCTYTTDGNMLINGDLA